MLNGLDPIIIFNFKKLLPQLNTSGIPLLQDVTDSIPLTPIPIYLSEKITGLYVDSEAKHIDIDSKVQTLANGEPPKVLQSAVDSTVTVNLLANENSIGLAILSTLCDLIVPKVTSEEYSISYINKAVTVFGGLLSSFSVNQNRSNNLYNVSFQISRSTGGSTVEKAANAPLARVTGATP